MKRKDIFFACLFMVCFLVSAVVMAGDYLCKMLEKDWGAYHESQMMENPETKINDSDVKETSENQQADQQSNTQADQQSNTQEPAEELPKFQTVDYEYFDDALFIGDSRTVGLMEYGNLTKATFFADSGMSIYGLALKKIAVPGMGKVTFDEILEAEQYGKIYLMLGMNELGYHFETTKERYQKTVEKICAAQEDAVIYLCANMHVTKEQSQKDDIYNNENVNLINEVIAGFADGERIVYLDVNELFDDEEGYLNEEYTSDAFHVLGKYYKDWVDWLCTKAVILPE